MNSVRKGMLFSMALLLALMPAGAWADDKAKAADRVEEARQVLEEIMAARDKNIPADLLGKVAAVAIFPGVVKAGFIVGGKYGRGVVLRRSGGDNRWSAPAFYSIAAGSFGWQAGAQSTDLILLIRSERGLEALLRNEMTLGGDASVAAGPVGREAKAAVDVSFKTEIWSYSRSRGLFAGLSLEGAKITPLYDYNKAYYGRALTSGDILMQGITQLPPSAQALVDTLKKYAKSSLTE